MDLRRLDLNLLTVLHVLLEEAHVSRAALRLAMSQPATSSALDRCRRLFDDPLLERVGNTMRPTAKADALRQPLADIISKIGGLVTVEGPALKDLRQTVHIVAADGLASTITGLHRAVSNHAPGITLVVHPWSSGTGAVQALEKGAVDLAVSVLPHPLDESVHVEVIRKVTYKVMMRHDHPAAQAFDLERWLAWPHLIVSAAGATRTPIDDALADLGLRRHIGMVLPSFLLAPEIIRNSHMIALFPAISQKADDRCFATFDPPISIEGFALHLAWHRRQNQNLPVQFVADQIRDLLTRSV